jgi:hypothetical protein
MRRVVAVLVLTMALIGFAAWPAIAGGPNNVVLSDATADFAGAATFTTHWNMVAEPTGTDEVTSANVARALAHDCTGCQAIAVAFQAVLTTGNPHTVAPRNFAFAENLRCDGCAAFAFAFQYVVSTGGPAHLGPAGRQGIEDLRSEVAADLATDLTPDELNARLTDIGNRFQALVNADIVRTGGSPHDGEMQEQMDRAPVSP